MCPIAAQRFPGTKLRGPISLEQERQSQDTLKAARREFLLGYESSLHLIDVKIKAASVPVVKRMLKSRQGRRLSPLRDFLERAVLDSAGFLRFKASADGKDPYVPDEEGTVPALFGKWHKAERIAGWLRQHCEEGGRIILHSTEADGAAWGWEFDGRGRMRAMVLRPLGKWE